mmetsp:Transcript_60915/g.163994  ORF Transcript_60915/g.163994 Transcript_60915/m.163994 type:complete len:87 (+) Transcript_60915:551-811(+)
MPQKTQPRMEKTLTRTATPTDHDEALTASVVVVVDVVLLAVVVVVESHTLIAITLCTSPRKPSEGSLPEIAATMVEAPRVSMLLVM